jgi:drug/metabolite transporter (DMT)-like permease
MAKEDTLAATAVLFGFATLGLGAYGLDEVIALEARVFTAGLVAAMLFAVLGATVASYLLNVWAIKRAQASHVALFIFLQPLVAAALGVLALGEQVTARLLIALALVFAALALRDGRDAARALSGVQVERPA